MNDITLINIAVKNAAPIETNATTSGKIGFNTIDSAAIDVIKVPNIPINRHIIFLFRQIDNAFGEVIAPKYTPKNKIISDITLNPKAIQAVIPILGIKLKLNNTPIMAPITMLAIIAMQQHAPEPDL